MAAVRWLGIATLALAVAGAGFALLAPLSSSETCLALSDAGREADVECETDRSSLLEDESIGTIVMVALATVAPAGVVAAAAQSTRLGARLALWAGALWLVGLTLLAILSVGIFIAPAALTGLAAAVLSLRSRAVDSAAV